MNTRKYFKLFGLLIGASVILAACGTAEPETIEVEVTRIVEGETIVENVIVTVTPEMIEPVTVTILQFGPELAKRRDDFVPWENWWNRKIQEFNNLNPDIQIEWQMKGQESGGTTLFIDAAVAAGEPPDIYIDAAFRASKYAGMGILDLADDVLTDEEWARYTAASIGAMTSADGEVWGIPMGNAEPGVIAVNRTLVKKLGAEDLLPQEPDRDWTLEEWETFCDAVSDAGAGRYCTMWFAKTPSFDYTLTAYGGAFGAELYTGGDYCQSTINSDEAVEWMQWMNSMVEKGYVVPGAAGLTDEDLDVFWANEAIVMAGGAGWYKGFSAQLVESGQFDELEVYTVNYPYSAGRSPTAPYANSGWSAVAFAQTDPAKRAAVIKLLQWIAQPAWQAEFAKGYLNVPDQSELAADWAGEDVDRQWLVRMVDERGIQDMGYNITNFNEVRLLYAEARQAIWGGDVTEQEGLDQFVSDIEPLLCDF